MARSAVTNVGAPPIGGLPRAGQAPVERLVSRVAMCCRGGPKNREVKEALIVRSEVAEPGERRGMRESQEVANRPCRPGVSALDVNPGAIVTELLART